MNQGRIREASKKYWQGTKGKVEKAATRKTMGGIFDEFGELGKDFVKGIRKGFKGGRLT
jgi:hypothetical protein